MKTRTRFILILGLVLVVASFVAYAIQAAKYDLPPMQTEQEVTAWLQEHDLDRPLAVQFGVFLLLFIPGTLLLAAFGMFGLPKPEARHTIISKIFMMMMLVTNIIISTAYLLIAPASTPWSLSWWGVMILAVLSLGNLVFILAVWNGRKWGLYCFMASSFVIMILDFLGGIPLFSALFLFSAPFVLYWLVRSALWQME
jgi:hypothetical protein